MKPKVAHISARIQIVILMGTVPFAVLVALIALPFGLMNGVYALFVGCWRPSFMLTRSTCGRGFHEASTYKEA